MLEDSLLGFREKHTTSSGQGEHMPEGRHVMPSGGSESSSGG